MVGVMPYRLKPVAEGFDILLDKPIVLVGRHHECDVQILSRKISRKHCCIAQVDDYLVVRDLFSTNGVQINGVRVEEGNLKPGDELTIGHFRYHVSVDAKEDGSGRRKVSAIEPGSMEAKDPLDQPVALDDRVERVDMPTEQALSALLDDDDIIMRPAPAPSPKRASGPP